MLVFQLAINYVPVFLNTCLYWNYINWYLTSRHLFVCDDRV